MGYYDIWVGSARYMGKEPLTYASNTVLKMGQLVRVKVREQGVLGFVARKTSKPTYTTKEIIEALPYTLPSPLRKLHHWLTLYYPGPSGPTTNLFLPPSLLKTVSVASSQLHDDRALALPPLTAEQVSSLGQIRDIPTALLHGETGTGKTRVYLELAKEHVKNGKSVLILTPEIGLTPQLAQTVSDHFPGRAVVMHSDLSVKERREQWLRAYTATEPLIIIGPRSALFMPLNQLGLLVVDEAHERTYKQEQAPYYQTTRVAAQLARLHGAQFILGSATPLIADHYLFEQKQLPIIRMTTPAIAGTLPPSIDIVDMRAKDERGNRPGVLSTLLATHIEQTLAANMQILLFLNRRGSARLILCQACGWQALCPVCDVPLTYHHDQHNLQCHTCGYKSPITISCPTCQSSDIIYNSPGTKFIEQEVRRRFPEANVRRFDGDNLSGETLADNYPEVANGTIDIIIGTQIIGKGLDLPKLSLVGVINTDTSLQFPDFTAEEQTYQLLHQVIGRVGRRAHASKVILQTYHPDNKLLRQVAEKDWLAFYKQQLVERQAFGFPPFNYALQLSTARASRHSAQQAAQKLAQSLSKLTGVEIRGPSARLHEQYAGKYHWQLIVLARQRSTLIDVVNRLPSGWLHNLDPVDLL